MNRRLYAVLFSFATVGAVISVVNAGLTKQALAASPAAERDDVAAAAAFEAIVPVLRHPRCMNCHSVGDYPREGEDSHPHTMRVQRGIDGLGTSVLLCNSCHQDHNLDGLHSPPGARGVAFAAASGAYDLGRRSDHDLCELLKDPKQNGGRSVEKIVEHIHTPLVLWGWNPGEDRKPIPLPQETFLKNVGEWVD